MIRSSSIIVCASILLHASIAFCQEGADVVRFRDPKTGQEKKRTGEIVEYSGRFLVIKVTSGNEVEIPSGDVIGFEAEWSEAHKEANRLFELRDFPAAELAYNRALVEEQPQWVARRVMARRVFCLSAQNKSMEAADSFFRLFDADPGTQYFDAIPLSWHTQQIGARSVAQYDQWLKAKDSIKQLVAASWLLSTPSRAAAVRALDHLTNHTNARISLLATAQLWRTAAVRATPDDIAKWEAIVERIESDLRAGPLYVVGASKLKTEKDVDAAVLMMMKIPLLFPKQYQLAARAMFDSASAVQNASRSEEASIMLRELVANYTQTGYAAEAKKILDSMNR